MTIYHDFKFKTNSNSIEDKSIFANTWPVVEFLNLRFEVLFPHGEELMLTLELAVLSLDELKLAASRDHVLLVYPLFLVRFSTFQDFNLSSVEVLH